MCDAPQLFYLKHSENRKAQTAKTITPQFQLAQSLMGDAREQLGNKLCTAEM